MITLKRVVQPVINNGVLSFLVEALTPEGETINTYFTAEDLEKGYSDEEEK